MPYRFLAALFLVALILPPAPAQAKLMFGTDEKIHFIQDVTLKGPQDEALFLGFKTSAQSSLPASTSKTTAMCWV